MPEGDSLRRIAEGVRALEGEIVTVESPHPRAASLGIAERLDGRRLERVEAVGKNLLLTFEGAMVLRSHLGMRGRWQIRPVGKQRKGTPWLVLRGREVEALQWNGPVLELASGRERIESLRRLGPDILDDPVDLDAMLERFRSTDQARPLGQVLLDQRLVSGIGNKWKAEALFLARLSPWRRLSDTSDEAILVLLAQAAEAMRGPQQRRLVYRRAGLPCRRCGTRIESRGQGEHSRRSYWCPRCQPAP